MKLYIFVLFCTLSYHIILGDEEEESSDDFIEDFRLYFLREYKPPPRCPPNEAYKYCMKNCTTCEGRNDCEADCSERGCDCISHFYRLEPGGPCQPASMCPIPECRENEVFRECGPLCEKCSDFKCRAIQCDHNCYCKEGYLRDDDGVCVPETECPQRNCTETEEWAETGPADEYCMHGEGFVTDNATKEVPQCYCTKGYKRNAMGMCIPEEYCSRLACFGKETYYDCIPKCNTTCHSYGDPDCEEDENCYAGCFCRPGYIMDDRRHCVSIESCVPGTESVKISTESPETESTLSSHAFATSSTEAVLSSSATQKATEEDTTKHTDSLTTGNPEDDTEPSTDYEAHAVSDSSSSSSYEEKVEVTTVDDDSKTTEAKSDQDEEKMKVRPTKSKRKNKNTGTSTPTIPDKDDDENEDENEK